MTEKNITLEPLQPVRKSKRLPFAKQSEKLDGVPYHRNNNKKKLINNGNLQEKTTTATTEGSKVDYNKIR